MRLKKDPQGSVYDLAIEIRKLVSLAHSYVPVEDRKQTKSEYLIHSADNRAIQRYLLSVDTFTVEGTVKAIDEYFAIGTSDRTVCKAVGEDTASNQLTKLEVTLAAGLLSRLC